jgi:deferrochelatase/peroxidase EfeB
VLIVAADHSTELARKVADITGTAAFNAGVQLLLNQEGRTRSDAFGHEYFGFQADVSQPEVCGVHSDEFVIGYETQIATQQPCHECPSSDLGPTREAGSAWTKDGAYVVFRRLSQDVPPLEKSIQSLARLLGWSEEMTGAKLIGRHESSCMIEQVGFQTGSYIPPSIVTTAAMPIDPGKAPAGVQHSVTRTGGEEYFFSPSLNTLQALGNWTI